jgi:hypothetical protein
MRFQVFSGLFRGYQDAPKDLMGLAADSGAINKAPHNPLPETTMKTTAASRIVAALMSACITLVLLNAVALYGHPHQSGATVQLAKNAPNFSSAMSGHPRALRSYQ